jgi:hypothetical protein
LKSFSFNCRQLDLEMQPDRFEKTAYAPQAHLVVGGTLYAAAGIGIGCAIAGALIAAVVMTLLGKKKKGSDWQRQADAAIVKAAPGSTSYKLYSAGPHQQSPAYPP